MKISYSQQMEEIIIVPSSALTAFLDSYLASAQMSLTESTTPATRKASKGDLLSLQFYQCLKARQDMISENAGGLGAVPRATWMVMERHCDD